MESVAEELVRNTSPKRKRAEELESQAEHTVRLPLPVTERKSAVKNAGRSLPGLDAQPGERIAGETVIDDAAVDFHGQAFRRDLLRLFQRAFVFGIPRSQHNDPARGCGIFRTGEPDLNFARGMAYRG